MKRPVDSFLGFVASPLFLWLTFGWFVFQAAFMAISTNLGISPDETYHYNLIQLFAKNGWLPFIHNQYGMYSLGEVTHLPFFLYHYLLSLPYHFFSGSSHDVTILRFINIGFASLSFYLIVKLAARLKISPLVRNLSLFMLANTLMFTFLSGSINYDNLLLPISLGSFLMLFKVLDKPSSLSILGLLLLLMSGMLTAINFLPVAAIIIVVLVYKYIAKPRDLLSGFSDWKRIKAKGYLLALASILLGLIFVQRYGLNLVKYHSYEPACNKINTVQQCLQDGIIARKNLPPRPLSPKPTVLEYATGWSESMRTDTYGILGHKSIVDNKMIRLWSEVFILLGLAATIRYYKPSRDWNIIILAGLVYTIILFVTDYRGYLHSGYNFGVQGRYLFIFLPLFYFLASNSILVSLRKPVLKSLFVLGSLVIFATACLPTYILKTTDGWHTTRAIHLNQVLRKYL